MEMVELVEGIPYQCLEAGMGDWGFETFPQYLDLVERRGVGINVAVNIAHHPVKVYVMGPEAQDRYSNDTEWEQQRAIFQEGLEAGAVGCSVFNGVAHIGPGGKPVPSRLTLPKQFHSLMRLVDDFGRGGLDVNMGLAFNTVSAPKLGEMYDISWNHAPIDYDTAAQIAANGVRWHVQASVLPNAFEAGLEDPFMFCIDMPTVYRVRPLQDLINPLFDLTPAERLETYKQTEFRRRYVEGTDNDQWNERYWPCIVVSYFPMRPEMEGKRLTDLARERGVTPAEVMLDMAIESDLEARWIIEKPNREPEEWVKILRTNPSIRLGNGDAGAHQGQLADYRWPTVLLSEWVREHGLELERAIQLMTAAGANSYGIADRGVLTAGYKADVVVFDPETVQDGPLERVNDLPGNARRLVSDGLGIEQVIVNGTVLRERGENLVDPEGDLPGKLLREFMPNRDRSVLQIAGVS
jgi:N-acyl-D-aspartate/D-glutamate deacylase